MDTPPKWEETAEVPPSFEETTEVPVAASAQLAAPANEEVSAIEALLRGGAQGATLGFSDELAGGGEALIDKILGNDQGKSLGDLYSQHVAEARAANEAAHKAHPYLFTGGNLAGGLASGALTGGLGAESALARIGMAAGQGAAAGVGFGNADNLGDAAKDALKGGAIGGLTGTAVEGVSQTLNPNNLEKFANNRSAAAMGIDKAARKRMGDAAVQRLGRGGLDEGIVSPLATTGKMLERADNLVTQGEEGMQGVYNAIDSAGAAKIDPAQLAGKVDSELGNFWRSPLNKDVSSQLDNILEAINMRGKAFNSEGMTLTEAQTLKNELKRVGWPNGRKTNPSTITDKQRMAQEAWSIVNKSVDEATERGASILGEEGLPAALKTAKDQYGTAKGAQQALENKYAGEQGNRMLGITDFMTLGTGYAAHGGPGAVALEVAKKVGDKFANQTAAWGADKLADVVRATPEALGPWATQLSEAAKRGGASLAATNYVLQQTSPEYRDHMRKLFDK